MNAVTKLLSCSEIKELDCKTTENKKITSLDLMSDAVLAVENWILNNYKKIKNFQLFVEMEIMEQMESYFPVN